MAEGKFAGKAEFMDEVSKAILLRQTVSKENALFRGPKGNISPFRIQPEKLPLTLIPVKPSHHYPSAMSSINKSLEEARKHQTNDRFQAALRAQQCVNDLELKPIQKYMFARTESQEIGWLLTCRGAQMLGRSQNKWHHRRAQCQETKFASHPQAGRSTKVPSQQRPGARKAS